MKYCSILTLFASVATAAPALGFYNGQIEQSYGIISTLENGTYLQFNSDGNLVVYNGNHKVLKSTEVYAPYKNCTGGNSCTIRYQTDGNLVAYWNSQKFFATNTDDRGALLMFTESKPWLTVLDISGNKVWSLGS